MNNPQAQPAIKRTKGDPQKAIAFKIIVMINQYQNNDAYLARV